MGLDTLAMASLPVFAWLFILRIVIGKIFEDRAERRESRFLDEIQFEPEIVFQPNPTMVAVMVGGRFFLVPIEELEQPKRKVSRANWARDGF